MITSPHSAAQIAIQAAEYIRRYGAFVPYDISAPLLPALIAILGFVGIPGQAAYILIVLAAYVAGSVAVYLLVRQYQSVAIAAFAAIVYALAPTRLPPASFDHGSLLVSWSFAPVLLVALDSARRRPRVGNIAAAIGAAVLMWASNPAGLSTREIAALVELMLVVGVSLLEGEAPRRGVLAAFAAFAGWAFFVAPSAKAVPQPLVNAVPRQPGNPPVFGAESISVQMNPVRARAREVVAAPGRLEESLLWLRAMAVGFLVSDDHQKFSRSLDCIDRQGGWCLYTLPNPSPAPAVLVSRRQWKNLPPVRGLYDIEGLNRYIAWAGRPEPAGFVDNGNGTLELQANLGPLDIFLIRRNCQPAWRAYLETDNSKELEIECDPLGFMVVDPAHEGDTRVRLEFEPSWRGRLFPTGMPARPLSKGQFPRITPGGIVAASEFKPPPFQPGTLLTIFGDNFAPGDTRVSFGGTPGDVVWVGPQQVNVLLPPNQRPGQLPVTVESGGHSSFAETIEVRE